MKFNFKLNSAVFYPFIIFFFLVGFKVETFGQLQVTQGTSALQLATAIAGGGVGVSNATYTGDPIAAGTFSNGNSTNIGLNNGVILTTGNIQMAVGANNMTDAGANNSGGPYTGLANTFNAAILEFDVVPSNNQLTFQFVFGSEEYPEFVNQYNDGFGILLTGPGITGSQNIATLPGTSTAVNINNVNGMVNTAYYIDNTLGTSIQYDGFTTVITASRPL